MHKLFQWLAGLFGVFVIIYGGIILAKTLHRGHLGLHQGITDGLLIISGLVILILTRPRSKAPK